MRILVPRTVRVYPKAPEAIGEHIKKRRVELGLSQGALADSLGIGRDCVSLWERGRIKPRGKNLAAVVQFVGYDPRLQVA